jgi:hypothetical protein
MSNIKGKTLRLTVSEAAYEEFQILSIRNKKTVHDLMVEVIEKFADKKKDKTSLTEQ